VAKFRDVSVEALLLLFETIDRGSEDFGDEF
jgi:hypothetical protein